jgi:hypothetical protein
LGLFVRTLKEYGAAQNEIENQYALFQACAFLALLARLLTIRRSKV